ncbi:MAG: YoaP domain-containing protein [Bulleidia sp.]
MENTYIRVDEHNMDTEHLCCALSNTKHADGVKAKKAWLKDRFAEGYTFYKLDVRGKVFIEYGLSEYTWQSIEADNDIVISCLWTAGKYAGQGHGSNLLDLCIQDAKQQGRNGICLISSRKKKPFLSDPGFFLHKGFTCVDEIGDYCLLALQWKGENPHFTDRARSMKTDMNGLVIYVTDQCPFHTDSIRQAQDYCQEKKIECHVIHVTDQKQARNVPCVFSGHAVFYNGRFVTEHRLNRTILNRLGI